MVVRLSKSSVGQEETDATARVLAAGYLGMGEEVRLFEEEIAAYLGGDRHVICVATGTAGLHLAMSALDIGPGDEVLVPTVTYVASFQAVSATGATPVACDIRENDGFIDLADAQRRLTPRTRAIMPVHYASGARGLAAVNAFAQANGLRVIEDAAHAFGCIKDGVRVGAAGDIVCFSFDGIKNITSGEGGAIVTSDEEVARRCRDGRLLGVEKDTEKRYSGQRSWTFDVRHQGFRYHMSNLMAAIGRAQLAKVEKFSARRIAVAERYRRELHGLNGLSLLDLEWDGLVPHIFIVRVPAAGRDGLREHLRSAGVESGFHYQPNHTLTMYGDDAPRPAADAFAQQIVTLPMHADLTEAEQGQVIAAIRDFFHAG